MLLIEKKIKGLVAMLTLVSLLIVLIFGAVPMTFAEEGEEGIFNIHYEDADYDGYIFKLQDGNYASYESDTDITPVYEPENIYQAPTIEEIKNNVDSEQIEYIEPNYIGTYDEDDASFEAVTNDPCLSYQWGLDMTRGSAVWISGTSATGATIGILDTGINSHEDLNSSYIKTGYNYYRNNTTTTDTYGHGTRVASVIAATTNNGKGVASTGYKTSIVPLVIGETAPVTSCVVSALYDAADKYGCDVVNMSFSVTNTTALKEACSYASSNGVLLVAAVGNGSSTTMYYPASYDTVIGVGSINKNGVKSSFSNYNSSVFVVAPGENIYMAQYDSQTSYGYSSGTSFAAPFVVALGGIAKAYNNSMSLSDFLSLLKVSSVDKGASGYDTSYGWGLIDCGLFIYNLTGKDYFSFSDVSSTHWAISDITYCVRYGIFGGVTSTTFEPDIVMTRADAVTVLGRLYEMTGGSITFKDDSFPDTVNGSYYSKYVAWANENGIIGGYNDGRFGPNDSMTREQMAVILYRYAKYTGVSIGTVNLNVLNAFSDKDSISSYAQTEMAWCVQNGIIGGVTSTTICPADAPTRAASATMMHRYSSVYAPLPTYSEVKNAA